MAVTSDSSKLEHQPVSSLLVQTLITAFTFLSALSIRDTITQSISALTPHDTSKKLLFTMFITMFFLFATVLMAYTWQDKI